MKGNNDNEKRKTCHLQHDRRPLHDNQTLAFAKRDHPYPNLAGIWSKKKEDLVGKGFWYLLAYALIAAVLVGLYFLITAVMGLFK